MSPLINNNHPFAVEAFFRTSIVITYSINAELARRLVPEPLEIDTFNGEAFIAVAIVDTRGLRPKGFPKFLGSDFILAGYRVFVKYTSDTGKKLRGLYILRSETNKKSMGILSKIYTRYDFATTDISIHEEGAQIQIISKKSGIDIEIECAEPSDIPLPDESPFSTWQEARKYAGPLPYTFTVPENSNSILIVEGRRQYWQPKPVLVKKSIVPYVEEVAGEQLALANAFIVKDIPYHWKKGRLEQL